MSTRHLATLAFLSGCAAKGAVQLVWHLTGSQVAYQWAANRDPLVMWSAMELPGIFCSPSGVAPSPCAVTVVETWNVLGFGLECAFVALMISLVVRTWRARRTRS